MSLFSKYAEKPAVPKITIPNVKEAVAEPPAEEVETTEEFWELEGLIHTAIVEELKKKTITSREEERKLIEEKGEATCRRTWGPADI
jgi:hypothetical protein